MDLRSFRAYDKDALQVDTCSPELLPGLSISNNATSPDGTIYRFDETYPSARVTPNGRGGSDVSFVDEDGKACIVENAGPQFLDQATLQADSLQYLQEVDDNNNLNGPTRTLAIFSARGTEHAVWGFYADGPLASGARYCKVGGSDHGSIKISELFSSSEKNQNKINLLPKGLDNAKPSAARRLPRFTFHTLDQSDLMRRVQNSH